MDLCSQVVNLDLSKRLHELGVTTESYFVHVIYENKTEVETREYNKWNYTDPEDMISAYTTGELGQMLPPFIEYEKYQSEYDEKDQYFTAQLPDYLNGEYFEDYKEADCRAKALIYCIENGLRKIEDINNEI